jgi:glycine/D-amino acid oxidase-like deaminating enzyme
VDVAVVGGGIVGVSAAAFLAEGGANVTVVEPVEIGAGASGRNSGAVQHPFDPVLTPLYEETRALYGIERPPDGLLTLSTAPEPVQKLTDDVEAAFPELEPQLLDPGEVERLEPAVVPGLWACRTETAWAVPPAKAVQDMWSRAQAAGARLAGWPEAFELESDVTLVAAGAASSEVADPTGAWWRPIQPVWGVVAEVELPAAPRHVLEEAGIPELADALAVGEAAPQLFSLVSADGRHGLGSSFTPGERPDEAAVAAQLRQRGERFLSSLGRIVGTRACPRPVSFDGRPLLGHVRDDLWICAGHGPWGISIGPASARLVADAILGRDVEIPPELDAAREGGAPGSTRR